MSKGKLIVISGASGVGKGTVLALAMEKRKDLSFSVSAQLQSLCEGPKSATLSNTLAAVPSRPYLNEHRTQ